MAALLFQYFGVELHWIFVVYGKENIVSFQLLLFFSIFVHFFQLP